MTARRRALAGVITACLTSATLVGLTQAPGTSKAAPRQTAKISATPAIVQPGKKPASANAAKSAITVKFRPKKKGRPVILQRRAGNRWVKAGKTKQDKSGKVFFAARTIVGGAPATYRAQAKKFAGLKKVKSKPITLDRWATPSYTDNFTGSALLPEWSHRGTDYNPEGLRRCSKGDPKAVRVGGGAVRLSVIKDNEKSGLCTAKRANGGKIGKFNWRLNGHISTGGQETLRYGWVAARMKFQKRRGQHASLWMQSQVPANEPTTEIDIIEWFGDKSPAGGLTSFIYHPQGGKYVRVGDWIKNPDSYLSGKKDDWFKAYHVFSLEWTPTKYVFRIDGKETFRTSRGVAHTDQYPILSLLSSDYELPHLEKEGRLPQHSYVDWIRMWQA